MTERDWTVGDASLSALVIEPRERSEFLKAMLGTEICDRR